MSNEQQRKSTRQRVALHRARKAEEADLKQEQAAERQALVQKHGEEKVSDREYYDERLVPVSLEILNYLQGKKTTWLKLDSPTLDEDIQGHFDELEKQFSPAWYQGHLDNSYERCARMGLLPYPSQAAKFFRDLYNTFKAGS